MKGVLNRDFTFIDMSYEDPHYEKSISESDDDSIIVFEEGVEYEIIKVIKNESYNSGTALVLFNEENAFTLTVDSSFVKVLQPESNKWEAYWNQ